MIDEKAFKPPFYLRNKHLQTILPSLNRKIDGVKYVRERIITLDNDFIDVDWSKVGSSKLVFLLHGLEGHSYTQYIKGVVKVLNNSGYDTLSVNFRSCSGETNKLLKSYNCGVSDDAKLVIDYVSSNYDFKELFGVGFSLGGNVLLKYLGEEKEKSKLKKAIGVSVPLDLKSSALHLEKGFNKIYLNRFLKNLKVKVEQKKVEFPEAIDYEKTLNSVNFREFDEHCTAPIHGYEGAFDYWDKCSSKPLIPKIKTETVIINALNDPFLTPECFPFEEVKTNDFVDLLTPKHGGHVGFPKIVNGLNYYEAVILDFFNQ